MTFHRSLKMELAENSAVQLFVSPGGGRPDRIFPLVIPQKVPGGALQIPAVVYNITSVERQVTYCGTSNLSQSDVQIDCYCETYDAVKELASAVRACLLDFHGVMGNTTFTVAASLDNEFDGHDFEPGLYRVTQLWTFWNKE